MILVTSTLSSFAQGNGNGNAYGVNVNVPEVAILALRSNSSTSINLDLGAPDEAGLAATGASDSSVWMNYTFVKGKNSRPKVNVYAKISSGTVPSGLALKVTAKACTSHGNGNKGGSTGQITLTNTDQMVVQNIKTSNTGNGANKGHCLVYNLDITDYSSLQFTTSASDVEITYTMAD